jgi:hypothetical protein
MFHDAFYLIEPLPQLTTHLAGLSEPDFTKTLGVSVHEPHQSRGSKVSHFHSGSMADLPSRR